MFGLFKRRQKNVKKQIRPLSLQDFTGQSQAKLLLSVALSSAKQRMEQLEHVVLYGPPGLGKTTLSNIIANELGVDAHYSIGTSLQTCGALMELFDNVFDGDIVFIDEIHRIPTKVEELLYTAMEDGHINNIKLPKFTLIGATTRMGDLSEPLRDRFGISIRLVYYSVTELATIAQRTADVLGVTITTSAAELLASRARGTPRILNNFVRRATDVMHATKKSTIDDTIAAAALELLEIDSLGLDRMDRRILRVMYVMYEGKPVGINTLAVSVGEPARTIQEVYEPYLIQQGLIIPTSSGRMLSTQAIEHIKEWLHEK
ncbi:MAG: Holliday junction branch migration DNA helicase RuvB [Bacteroidales bacterium]|nr:Holliday junction branch migration DNA helicase RuvB [Bacteroidales bacterium]